MTLLIAIIAAIVSSILWYRNIGKIEMKLGTLALMYWGASLMWVCDAVAEYIELGAAYFTPDANAMLNDAFLGVWVVALGLIIWLAILFIKDPEGKIKAKLAR